MYFPRIFYTTLFLVMSLFVSSVSGKERKELYSPACGILCDKFICADPDGISPGLTEKYLGEKAAKELKALGEYNPKEFTFLNGVFCDVKEKLCRNDRYFDKDGKRSGKINRNATMMLFGCVSKGCIRVAGWRPFYFRATPGAHQEPQSFSPGNLRDSQNDHFCGLATLSEGSLTKRRNVNVRYFQKENPQGHY